VQVEPAQVTVWIDQVAEREILVQPQLVGELPAGYEIERVLLMPNKVKVRGPKTILDSASIVSTLPIDVTGRRTSFREQVDLAPLESNVIPLQRRGVEADVRIVEAH
jgi:YbbR domain-containing protein